MIVVEYNDTQYSDVMEYIECIEEKTRALKQLIGENSMSMRKGKRYSDDDEYYDRNTRRRDEYRRY